ncbi:MAG: FtsX-like permease family protein [Gemmatimonadaceae bacterium]
MTLYELGTNPLEIVGVVPNVRATVGETIQPVYYRSITQSPIPYWVLYVRVASFSPAITSTITNAVVKELPESGGRLKVYAAEEQRAERDMPAIAIFWLATGLAAMAMLISGLGLYGVASHATQARRKEYGIRAAMGASPRQLATMVFGDGLGWTALAAAISLPFVWVGMRVTTALVVGARQIPLAATVALVAIYFVVVFLALQLPAHRAASVSPSNALRSL